jgi:hypothetical protein
MNHHRLEQILIRTNINKNKHLLELTSIRANIVLTKVESPFDVVVPGGSVPERSPAQVAAVRLFAGMKPHVTF